MDYYLSYDCNPQCGGNHPHVRVTDDRSCCTPAAGAWCVGGQDRRAGIHTVGMEFHRHFAELSEALAYATERVGTPIAQD